MSRFMRAVMLGCGLVVRFGGGGGGDGLRFGGMVVEVQGAPACATDGTW
jgi:hypothetical protein